MKSILSKYGKIPEDYDAKAERNGLDVLYLSKNPNEINKKFKTNKDNFKKISSNGGDKAYIPGQNAPPKISSLVKKLPVTKPPTNLTTNTKSSQNNNVDKEAFNQVKIDLKFVKDVLQKKVDSEIIVKELRNYFMVDYSDGNENGSDHSDQEQD